ncbi:uncharacterized protein LOC106720052 [Papilio machaon]|uniref:uncharacterized protein LOC106720052 n=1 Tax=Papilio machaon TaxID=76193 RepID=UPI001E663959|nr:uncharacterized protein LOC106720052 [Papilio machaon]
MKLEMQKQTIELRESITKTIMDRIEEKLTPIIKENEKFRQQISKLEKEVEYLKREKKSNNIVIFGLDEDEKSTSELFQTIQKVFKSDLNMILEENEVNRLFRLGKNKVVNKPRPVLCSLINGWKKDEIMKNKKSLKKVYVQEDYTKEVLDKRKALLPKLQEEKKKGNKVYIKYDQLIVKEANINTEKRKRELSTSPQSHTKVQNKKQETLNFIKTNRKNAFDVMRSRSNSLTLT